MKKMRQKGQVLIMGLIIMVILALAIFVLFDVQSMIRAKIKTNTAETAASLAAAKWQQETLNLIGEINLIKGCVTMMEDDTLLPAPEVTLTYYQKNYWSTAQQKAYIRRQQIAARSRTLTEMQSRLAFMGPLVALAAAQQTAKNNGLASNNPALSNFHSRLSFELTYTPDRQQNGFLWVAPYLEMLGTLANQGGAIQPSGSLRRMPDVIGPSGVVLSDVELYRAIAGENWCYWQLKKIAKNGPESGDWYKISMPGYTPITESDIYPVLVGAGYEEFGINQQEHFALAGGSDFFKEDDDALPYIMWYKYNQSWYKGEDSEAYKEWVKDWVKGKNWRGSLKPGYDYEGPVAVAAAFVEVPTKNKIAFKSTSVRLDKSVRQADEATTMIGREPGKADSIRRGVWSKVLGSFNDSTPPNVIPMVLPVFKDAVVYPTYRPYQGTLINADDSLWYFLRWLARGGDIHDSPVPSQFSYYINQLLKLENAEWLKRGYNPAFGSVDSLPPSIIFTDDYKYPKDPNGAGWLQQAYVNFDAAAPSGGYSEDRARPLWDGSYRCYQGNGSKKYFIKSAGGQVKTNEMVSCEGSATEYYKPPSGGGGSASSDGSSASYGPPRM